MGLKGRDRFPRKYAPAQERRARRPAAQLRSGISPASPGGHASQMQGRQSSPYTHPPHVAGGAVLHQGVPCLQLDKLLQKADGGGRAAPYRGDRAAIRQPTSRARRALMQLPLQQAQRAAGCACRRGNRVQTGRDTFRLAGSSSTHTRIRASQTATLVQQLIPSPKATRMHRSRRAKRKSHPGWPHLTTMVAAAAMGRSFGILYQCCSCRAGQAGWRWLQREKPGGTRAQRQAECRSAVLLLHQCLSCACLRRYTFSSGRAQVPPCSPSCSRARPAAAVGAPPLCRDQTNRAH